MTSPPATLNRACADGVSRLRDLRARSVPVGFLVLAASVMVSQVGWDTAALAQFPIRQIPARHPQAATAPAAAPSTASGAAPDWASGATSIFPFTSPYQPAGVAQGQTATGSSLAAWVHQPHPAVARIVVPERHGVSLGSGTLVDVRGEFGLVVTNWHVIRDAAGPIQVEFPSGFQTTGEVVKWDKDWDLAALSIRRPPVAPVPISPQPPRPGQWLAIAGYGSGSWRMVSGACTQYLAPGAEFPYELVELAAEARQGDSGGPIFNERGELAGVLFGSGPGYTSGSYGGRVLQFLASVVPGGLPGGDAMPPSGTMPSQLAGAPTVGFSPLASMGRLHAGGPPYGNQVAAGAVPDGVITPPPQATALHTPPLTSSTMAPGLAGEGLSSDTAASVPVSPPPASEASPLTPVQPFAARPRPANPALPAASALSAPSVALDPLGVADGRSAWDGLRPVAEMEDEDPRVAVVPGRTRGAGPVREAAPAAGDEPGPASLHAELPPRREPPAAAHGRPVTSTEELFMVVWRWLAGDTLYDQAKTVLAIVGLVTLAALLLRQPARQGPYDAE